MFFFTHRPKPSPPAFAFYSSILHCTIYSTHFFFRFTLLHSITHEPLNKLYNQQNHLHFLPTPKTLEVSPSSFALAFFWKNLCSGRKSIKERPLLCFFASSLSLCWVGVIFPDLLCLLCNSHHANLCWPLHYLVWCRGSCFLCVATTQGV